MRFVRSVLLVAACMAACSSAFAQSGSSGLRLVIENGRATGFVLADIGAAVNSGAIRVLFPGYQPVGTPPVTAPTIFKSNLPAPVPTGGTIPVDAKIALTGRVVGKTLFRAAAAAAVVGTLWEAGKELYDIWSDVGLTPCGSGPCNTESDQSARWGFTSTTISSASTWQPIASYKASALEACTMRVPQGGGYSLVVNNQLPSSPTPGVSAVWNHASCQVWGYTSTGQRTGVTNYYVNAAYYQPTSSTSVAGGPAAEYDAIQAIEQNLSNPKIPKAFEQALALEAGRQALSEELAGRSDPVSLSFPSGTSSVQVGDPRIVEESPTTGPDGRPATRRVTETTTATVSGPTITYDITRNTQIIDNSTGDVISNTTQVVTPTTPTSPAPSDQKDVECGLPDMPPCKIDETGTPQAPSDDGQSAFRSLLPACLRDDWKTCIPELPDINWSFSLPSGCSPIPVPFGRYGLSQVDICSYQPVIHDLMSMLWAGAGLFAAIGILSGRRVTED